MGTHKTWSMKATLLLVLLCYIALSSLFSYSFSQGPNNRNVSVDTRVNITQSMPEVIAVILNNSVANITLNAGTTQIINCSIIARDYNGGSTITANATLYHNATSTWDAADDNNTHYTNGSCLALATGGISRNFTCTFAVQYYADPGYWTCNANVTDDYNYTASGMNRTFINALLALNVTTLIDYGNLAVGDTSGVQQANVTNLGNMNINVSVQGYGATLGDGLSFVCDVGNITVQHQKYNISNLGQTLTAYYNLSSSLTQIPGFTIQRQTNDSQQSLNATYWILYVPPNPFGQCNGTIVFQAESS